MKIEYDTGEDEIVSEIMLLLINKKIKKYSIYPSKEYFETMIRESDTK